LKANGALGLELSEEFYANAIAGWNKS
jgi:hypothetical protein